MAPHPSTTTPRGAFLTLVSAISDPVTFAPTPVAGVELVLDAEQRGAECDLAQRASELRGRGLEVRTAMRAIQRAIHGHVTLGC
jgi:hypothetical protein